MKLTAMDITNKEFKKGFRGYECEEIDEFLDKVAESYEVLYKENSNMKEKMSLLEEKIKHYERVEDTIQNTLILAQNAAEQAKANAKKEADMIMHNANETAQKILNKANNDVFKINDDYEIIKQDFIKFRSKFRHFMNAQMDMFENLESDFLKNYNIGRNVEDSKETIDAESEAAFSIKEAEVQEEDFSKDLEEIKSFFVTEE
ncbi:MAG: DivIVA domain-containing protein [Clostridiaceae bacterium]